MAHLENLVVIRHAVSSYNALRKSRDTDPEYLAFKAAYEKNMHSPRTRELADKLQAKNPEKNREDLTPILPELGWQAEATGQSLKSKIAVPDVVCVSPYLRAKQTLAKLTEGWPELANIPTIEDPRIREREHGLLITYNDKRVFFVNHPEQRPLFEAGEYEYRYPNGENIDDVKVRVESWLEDISKKFAGKRMLAVTHHETILVKRMAIEGLGKNDFLKIDEENKPINCGVTTYTNNGHGLELESYNVRHY